MVDKMSKEVILEFANITKTFLGGSIVANDDISLTVYKNEIHSIIGENGSGKSTLMSILTGLYKQEKGSIKLNGKVVNMHESAATKKYKIGMVHQHFHLVNNFSVLENILVNQGHAVSKKGFLSMELALEHYDKLTRKYNIKLEPTLLVRDLTVGQRQKVEVLKVLWEKKDILVLDEPTATLSVIEIDELLGIIEQLQKEGLTILFISHKLQEVKKISNRITILRKGKLISTHDNTSELTIRSIAELMIGSSINLKYPRRNNQNEIIFKAKDLSYKTPYGHQALTDINFEIKKGEIFGIAGIQDNGQEELLEIIVGLKKQEKGELHLFDKDISHEKIKNRMLIMSYIPTDRQQHGVIMNKSLLFNSTLNKLNDRKLFLKSFKNIFSPKKHEKILSGLSYVSRKSIFKNTIEIVKEYNVQGAHVPQVFIKNLSGGNQQKFVVGREMLAKKDFIVAGHPTRGLDIKAIDFIFKRMIQATQENKTILLYSLELFELLALCDRVAIMYRGKITKIIKPEDYSFKEVSKLIVGIE